MVFPIRFPFGRRLAWVIGLAVLVAVFLARDRRPPLARTMAVLDMNSPRQVAFSGDSRYFASAGDDGIRLYRMTDEGPVLERELPSLPDLSSPLLAARSSIRMLAAEPDRIFALVDLVSEETLDKVRMRLPTKNYALDGAFLHYQPKFVVRPDDATDYRIVEDRFVPAPEPAIRDSLTHCFSLRDARLLCLSDSPTHDRGPWEIMDAEALRPLPRTVQPDDRFIGELTEGAETGLLFFTRSWEEPSRLRLLDYRGQVLRAWEVDSAIDHLVGIDGHGALAAYSAIPPSIRLGTLADLPNLKAAVSPPSKCGTDGFTSDHVAGAFAIALTPISDWSIPWFHDWKIPRFLRFERPSEIYFHGPGSSRESPFSRFVLSRENGDQGSTLDAKDAQLGCFRWSPNQPPWWQISPCGRMAAVVLSGQSGKVILLDLVGDQ